MSSLCPSLASLPSSVGHLNKSTEQHTQHCKRKAHILFSQPPAIAPSPYFPLREKKKSKDESQGSRCPFLFPLTPSLQTFTPFPQDSDDLTDRSTVGSESLLSSDHCPDLASQPHTHQALLPSLNAPPGLWGQTLSLSQLQSADLHGSCGPSASHVHIDCLQICASHYERKIPNGVGIAKRAL